MVPGVHLRAPGGGARRAGLADHPSDPCRAVMGFSIAPWRGIEIAEAIPRHPCHVISAGPLASPAEDEVQQVLERVRLLRWTAWGSLTSRTGSRGSAHSPIGCSTGAAAGSSRGNEASVDAMAGRAFASGHPAPEPGGRNVVPAPDRVGCDGALEDVSCGSLRGEVCASGRARPHREPEGGDAGQRRHGVRGPHRARPRPPGGRSHHPVPGAHAPAAGHGRGASRRDRGRATRALLRHPRAARPARRRDVGRQRAEAARRAAGPRVPGILAAGEPARGVDVDATMAVDEIV